MQSENYEKKWFDQQFYIMFLYTVHCRLFVLGKFHGRTAVLRSIFIEFYDLVKFVMCPFCKYIKRHVYLGNQGTHITI